MIFQSSFLTNSLSHIKYVSQRESSTQFSLAPRALHPLPPKSLPAISLSIQPSLPPTPPPCRQSGQFKTARAYTKCRAGSLTFDGTGRTSTHVRDLVYCMRSHTHRAHVYSREYVEVCKRSFGAFRASACGPARLGMGEITQDRERRLTPRLQWTRRTTYGICARLTKLGAGSGLFALIWFDGSFGVW